MAYVRIDEEESPLGHFGRGPGCRCRSCGLGNSHFAEWYVPEEDRVPESTARKLGSVPPTVLPPPLRIPSPGEVARMAVPIRPETPEERIRRILTTPPPPPPPGRRSFSQMFWRRVDDNLYSTMNRLGIPPSLRRLIRDAAHNAIQRGSESLLNSVLDRTQLSSEAKEAIRATVRAAARAPIL